MPDPQTPNLGLYIPARGADPGTWDTPVNTNMSALDAALGQTATVPITNVNVALSPAQYQCGTIVFSGTQTADVTITFPAFGRMYNIFNNCVNNNTWIIKLGVAAGIVCAPPGELTTVYTDGVNFFHLGMGTVGTYLPYAGSTVPRWISSSTQPPFLNCDGSAFSAITYPALAAILGSAVTPDLKGRAFYNLNQGSGRLTAIDGNTLFANGGNNALVQANIPNYALPVTDPNHNHAISDPWHAHGVNDPWHSHSIADGGAVTHNGPYNIRGNDPVFGQAVAVDPSPTGISIVANPTGISIVAHATGISVASGGSGTAYIPPSIVAGITMIRAG